VITLCVITLFFAFFLIGVSNDYCFYHSNIAGVIKAHETYLKSEKGPGGEVEHYYKQIITLKIKNGSNKGRTVELKNTYSESLVKSIKYHVGDDLFVTLKENAGKLSAVISGVKRDVSVAFIAGLFLIGMIFISRKQGILTIVSFCINIAVFIFAIVLYLHGKNFTVLCILMIFIFCVLTLCMSSGLTKKTFGAIISTFITLSLTFLIYKLATTFIGKLPYEMMDYSFGPDDLDRIFMTGILIGCLGAVMDVAITIHSAVNELVLTSKSITNKDLIHSIREIGYDIMGTMINVLLFSYISGSLPMIVIKIVNGYSLSSMIHFNIIFELIRFLVGSIGIVLSIPISGAVSVLLVRKGKVKC